MSWSTILRKIPFNIQAQRFECTGCGDCCRVEGDVWLNSQEIDAALESTNLTEVAFAAEFCDAAILPTPSSPSQRGSSGSFLRLRHATPGGGCALLDEEQKCSIYEARPLQCSTYPFWPRLLHSPQNWAAEASACEGIQPSAPEIDVPVATRQAEEWAAWLRRFPADYAAAADDARRWITDFVVPLSLCPYASAAAEMTRVSVSRSTTPASLAADVTSEARRLLLTPSVPTALVAAPAFTDLSEFLDIIYSLDESTGDPDLDGAILIAPFHPSFAFAGVDPASALHYEKRSPLPLVSILRAKDVEAIGGEEATARIAAANEEALLGRNGAEVAEIFKRLGRSGG
ncbi:hypothetical protein TL16_g10027 [Triparma laevis f. inornata]|uniref:YkgJ family cysteine cluster protein n=1 Tax=Triparma laevis f. inornata TaxID=1714386 RepID=A0A9W7BDJ9_9STRA|nr:hypothetical protein TL16_g10027 [Triparma laevis f. inornata]